MGKQNQNTQVEDLGMFFTPKFKECINHPLHIDSQQPTNIFCTKGEMTSKTDVIYGPSQTSSQQ